jgi:LPXTG-site transpeptidase (sortase) family protein
MYSMMMTGAFVLLADLGPLAIAEVAYRKDMIFDVKHTLAPVQAQVSNTATDSASPQPGSNTHFGDLPQVDEHLIQPASTDYGIVIEKINANARVIADVDPSNQTQYVEALSKGVAEAKGSTKPGEPGNLFLFSHSTDAPWNIIRFNAIFYLLREVSVGDKISIFYQNRRYDYIVYDKTIVPGDDVSFLTNRYDKPVLTLQTCDPPGTVANRLVVRAKLVGS